MARRLSASRIGPALIAAGAAALLAAGLAWRLARRPAGQTLPPSVLLITVDTLRADALGAYGGTAAPTPVLDRLAAAGVRFEAAHAHNVVTLPSHANILSGRYPVEHGVRDNAGYRFPEGIPTLATLLKARGYRTGAFVSAFPLAARFGLGRGFDVYDDAFVGARTRSAFLEPERSGPRTVDLARGFLAGAHGAPWFCWVHLYEPHYPYAPPEPYASEARDAYHGEVAAADAALGPLLEPLLAAGRGGRVLVVLTADHGESLGEHGEATHGLFAYEATLRVPLILYQPALLGPGVVAEPVGHVDLLPTVLEALGLPAPPGLPGRSLLGLARGAAGPAAAPCYFEALSGQLNRGWAPLRGLIRGRTKYVDLPIPELYDLRDDPAEATNLAPRQPQAAAELAALVAPFRAGDPGRTRVAESAEARERLRSLGYLSGAAPQRERYDESDDPKRLIALDAQLQAVAGLYLAGDLAGARARCRELVARRPGMALGYLYLAQVEREAGDLAAAVAALRRAAALTPGDPATAAVLAALLTQSGRAREAAELLEPYASRPAPDPEVLTTRGLALARQGRLEEALGAFGRARELEPANASTLLGLGTVQLMAGDRAGAAQSFQAALALSPELARAHSSLGALLAEEGRGAEAFEHWQAAIRLDPRECASLLELGLALAREGRPAEARPYLEFFVSAAPPALYAADLERARSWLAGHAARPAGAR